MRLVFILVCGCLGVSGATTSVGVLRVGSVSGTGAYESETTAYLSAITANSGTIHPVHAYAVDRFVKSAKANGYWPYITDCSPMAGDQTNAAVIKLVSHPSATQVKLQLYGGLTSADYTPDLGWNLSDGKFLWPGLYLSNSVFAATTNGASVWVSGFVTNSRGWFYGSDNNGNYPGHYAWGGNNLSSFVWNFSGTSGGDSATAPIFSSTVLSLAQGLVSISRVSGNSMKLYLNGIESDSSSSSVTTTYTNTSFFWLLGARSGSTTLPPVAGSLPGQYHCGFYAVNSGMPFAYQSAYYADVRELMRGIGRLAPRINKRLGFVITGQSNAQGAGASGTGTPSSIYGNLIGNASCFFFGAAGQTNTFSQRAISSEYIKYTGWTAFAEQLSYLARQSGYGDAYDSICESFAVNGAAYSLLRDGTQSFMSATNWAAQQNTLESTTYLNTLRFPAVLAVHGESDAGNSAYVTSITNWQSQYQTALTALTGDATTVPMLHSQIANYTQGAVQYANDGMLTDHEDTAGRIILVCPKYQFSYSAADNIHLDQMGYTRMGEQYGVAVFKLLSTGTYDPLRPTNIVLSAGTNITVSFTGYENNLVLDTNSFSWLTQPNYGFSYTDGSGGATINTVALQSSNQVVLTLNTDVSGHSARLLSYAQNSTTNGNCAGLPQGGGGNLRDASTTVGFVSRSNLWNWCVNFKKSVP